MSDHSAKAFLGALLFALAGCAEIADSGVRSTDENGVIVDPAEGQVVNILVIDTELLPVAGTRVSLTPGDLATNTTDDGRASFGPLAEGSYIVTAEKDGYAHAEAEFFIAQSPPERVILSMIPVAADVPYHLTHTFMAYIFCTVTVSGTFAPCLPLNVLTGEEVTQDRAEFNFEIPYPGLAELLHEMIWQKQNTGVDMSVTIRPPGAPLVVGGVTVTYLSTGGGSPLRNWVVTGVENEGASAPFDANESTPYTTIIRGRSTNTTGNAVSLYLDHRVANYFTFFYNRPGPRDFTVIPEE